MELEIEYEISAKAQRELFIKGENPAEHRVFRFDSIDLSEEGRRNWLELFGLYRRASLREPQIVGGKIFEDGSVEDNPPKVDFGLRWLELDYVIKSAQDVEKILAELLDKKKQLEQQLPQKIAEWEAAKAKWENIKTERQKFEKLKAEAKQEAREEIEKLKGRISELESYLRALIRACPANVLEEAGLVHGVCEESEEELTPEQREALETCGLSDC